jgi:hypothetical protein
MRDVSTDRERTDAGVEVSFGLPDGQTNGALVDGAPIPVIDNLLGGAAATYADRAGLYMIQEVLRLATVR